MVVGDECDADDPGVWSSCSCSCRYINRMLQKSTAAAAAANKTRSPTPHSQSYNLASPALLSTSPVPQHQQPTSSYFPQNPRAISPAAGLPTTSPGGSRSLGRSTTSMFGRKKSGSTGVVGAGESGGAGGKLPKEFLPGFWDVLGNEGGDAIWRSCEFRLRAWTDGSADLTCLRVDLAQRSTRSCPTCLIKRPPRRLPG